MQLIHLIHNPTAGDETHNKEHLIAAIEAAGFGCRYNSTKEPGWKALDESASLIAVAGGDGTVRKVVRQMLKKKTTTEIPLAVLAMGTANNIAKTFNLTNNTEQEIKRWQERHLKAVDTGTVENVPEVNFFLEGFGFGVFPLLMKEMKAQRAVYNSPEDELKAALKNLHHILLKYKPRQCQLEIDGTDHSGKFYMVEVMNIRSIGPNMVLAPLADPGDCEFEVVLIPEAHKEKFSDFLMHKLSDGEEPYQFHTLKGKNIRIRWDGIRFHADDKMLKMPKATEVHIQVNPGSLKIIVSADEPANR